MSDNPLGKNLDVCDYKSASCPTFNDVNHIIIGMVNKYYHDLIYYANMVAIIESVTEPISDNNNIFKRFADAIAYYEKKFPGKTILDVDGLIDLERKNEILLQSVKSIYIQGNKLKETMKNLSFFGTGDVSPSILLKYDKIVQEKNINYRMPVITKLVPIELPHHCFVHTGSNLNKEQTRNILQHLSAYNMSIFMKEAWLYCFTKNHIQKLVPMFNCIANCYILDGLPVGKLEMIDIYNEHVYKNNKHSSYKKWIEVFCNINLNDNVDIDIIKSKYGCFEMKEIEGTLESISEKLSISILFEYLYSKLILSYVGRIILTDDHFNNLAYITVNYWRHYSIKCNGCEYNFYMKPGKMLQFIDLERYIFNYSPYDIYTTKALFEIPNDKLFRLNNNMNRINSQNNSNNSMINDRGINTLVSIVSSNSSTPSKPSKPLKSSDISPEIIHNKQSAEDVFLNYANSESSEYESSEYELSTDDSQSGGGLFRGNKLYAFESSNEEYIAKNILRSPFIYDTKTFCQIMETYLPTEYVEPPVDKSNIKHYRMDLDDDSLRIIKKEMVYGQLI